MNIDEMSNIELCWDEFVDWCEDNGIEPGGHKDDWGQWWDCWSTAIATKIQADEAEEGDDGN
jgi:hypothetical protein